MTKRLIGLVMVVAMIVSLFSISVSAAGQHWITIDFEEDTVGAASASLPNEGSIPQGAEQYIEDEDGNKVFRFKNLSSTNAISTRNAGNVNTSEMMVMFDFKVNSSTDPAKKYLCIDLHAGSGTGTRYNLFIRENDVESGGAFSDGKWSKPFANTRGEWFTYLLHWKNVRTSKSAVDIYRKERGSDADFTYIGTSKPATNAGWGNATFRIYGNGIDCSLDNIVMWNGNVFEGGSFEMDGEVISGIEEVTDGELEAFATIISSDSAGSKATPIMVVFDSLGRMIGCEFGDESTVSVGSNSLSVSVDTGEFHSNLDGGAVEFYIWEDIELARPMVDAIVLD